MQGKTYKKILRSAACIAGGILLSGSLTLAALEGNTALYKSYVYTQTGEAVESPAAYQPVDVIESRTLGLNETMEPKDIFL